MKKLKCWGLAAALLCLGIFQARGTAAAAPKNTYKPASGGYTLTVPPGSKEIYHTSTGIRFTVGKDFLVSADLYTLPSFVSVPMKQYSAEQQKEFKKFLGKIQDQENDTIQEEGGSQALGSQSSLNGILGEKLRKYRATAGRTETVKPEKREASDTYTYVAVPEDKLRTHRPFLIGRAYQPERNVLLVVNVSAPENLEAAARSALQSLCSDLALSRVKYTDVNLLTVPGMGYEMEIPSGWRMYTLRADNVLFGRSLSSVHTDGLMIREFSDDTFAELGNSTPEGLKEAENAFIQKVTRYTPNITVLHHEPISVGTLNGSMAECTDTGDLKKVFVVNTYLMNPQGNGYQIRYQTDDTINYDLKLKAFKQSVESFSLLQDNDGSGLKPGKDM